MNLHFFHFPNIYILFCFKKHCCCFLNVPMGSAVMGSSWLVCVCHAVMLACMNVPVYVLVIGPQQQPWLQSLARVQSLICLHIGIHPKQADLQAMVLSDALAGEILKTTPTHECTKSEDIDWERRDQNRRDKDGLRNVKNSVWWINARLSGLNLGSESLSHQLWPWVIFEKNSSLELSVCYKGGLHQNSKRLFLPGLSSILRLEMISRFQINHRQQSLFHRSVPIFYKLLL